MSHEYEFLSLELSNIESYCRKEVKGSVSGNWQGRGNQRTICSGFIRIAYITVTPYLTSTLSKYSKVYCHLIDWNVTSRHCNRNYV